MKYICQVCEYVYDEEAEGVPFADPAGRLDVPALRRAEERVCTPWRNEIPAAFPARRGIGNPKRGGLCAVLFFCFLSRQPEILRRGIDKPA